ncbi:MAG: molybdopterin-synthase adenylyltransferase MoeB [Candidatus Poribacteria bacterium]|jgi:adenylyltransferase/sulfurtransferase|nr:molybdopterin-synthase adenylyltransferase MoeB [Candidatus Poribacteria bacterium]MDP6751535.1 molybdopterin-synthase adenylyltransferase MoeB [Candidatus Poribacteria bacterium]MDP6962217.1 molybdopterin-synthase adenylyltransferase MoeB [Dehalococcoidia bacterium]
MFNFSNEQIERYSRHIILKEVGGLGQTKLLESKILVIGAGGLGSPTALYLAAAGVGTLGIIDHDTVDISNLQRQILHGTSDVGQPKVVSAKATLNEINPDVEIVMYQQRLSSENVFQLFEDYDLVIDGCDNFPTRYLINDACVMMSKPNIHGSIFQFEGQVTVFYPGKGPCYRCLYPSPPPPGMAPSCQDAGVFGVLPGMVGSVQAVEAIKVLLEIGDPLIGQLLLFDALGMSFKRMKLHQDSECPICGANPTIHELIDYEEFCQVNW